MESELDKSILQYGADIVEGTRDRKQTEDDSLTNRLADVMKCIPTRAKRRVRNAMFFSGGPDQCDYLQMEQNLLLSQKLAGCQTELRQKNEKLQSLETELQSLLQQNSSLTQQIDTFKQPQQYLVSGDNNLNRMSHDS